MDFGEVAGQRIRVVGIPQVGAIVDLDEWMGRVVCRRRQRRRGGRCQPATGGGRHGRNGVDGGVLLVGIVGRAQMGHGRGDKRPHGGGEGFTRGRRHIDLHGDYIA